MIGFPDPGPKNLSEASDSDCETPCFPENGEGLINEILAQHSEGEFLKSVLCGSGATDKIIRNVAEDDSEQFSDDEMQEFCYNHRFEANNQDRNSAAKKLKEGGVEERRSSADFENGIDLNMEGRVLWYLCDVCIEAIQPNKTVYICEICEDHIVCKRCFKKQESGHEFAKQRVPAESCPPADWKYYTDPVNVLTSLIENGRAEISEKFEYVNVVPIDAGLTHEELLSVDDRELDRMLPLEELEVYNDDDALVRTQKKAILRAKQIRKSKTKKSKKKSSVPKIDYVRDTPIRVVAQKKAPEDVHFNRLKAYGVIAGISEILNKESASKK